MNINNMRRPSVEVPTELVMRAINVLSANSHRLGEQTDKLLTDLRPYIDKTKIPKINVDGRRWFQKSYGNTYHTVAVYINDELMFVSDQQYGYGDQYLQTALEYLKQFDWCPKDMTATTLDFREKLGAEYQVGDVERQKQLHQSLPR